MPECRPGTGYCEFETPFMTNAPSGRLGRRENRPDIAVPPGPAVRTRCACGASVVRAASLRSGGGGRGCALRRRLRAGESRQAARTKNRPERDRAAGHGQGRCRTRPIRPRRRPGIRRHGFPRVLRGRGRAVSRVARHRARRHARHGPIESAALRRHRGAPEAPAAGCRCIRRSSSPNARGSRASPAIRARTPRPRPRSDIELVRRALGYRATRSQRDFVRHHARAALHGGVSEAVHAAALMGTVPASRTPPRFHATAAEASLREAGGRLCRAMRIAARSSATCTPIWPRRCSECCASVDA